MAIELPDEARVWCAAAIQRARRALGPAAGAVRWVDPGGIHLTLKFLGAVPAAQLPELTARLTAELAGQASFRLAIGGLGVFPNQRRPRVVWLALAGNLSVLQQAQERVEVATEPLGYPREKRPFSPHLTLGRVRETAPPDQLAAIGSLAAQWPVDQSAPFAVTTASLMESHLSPSGARYTPLAELPFYSPSD